MEYEDKVISSYLALIKEKFSFLEEKKTEFVIRKKILEEAEELKQQRELKKQKAEVPKVEEPAVETETEESIEEEIHDEVLLEKAKAAELGEKFIPLVKDARGASTVRKVEPTRTDKFIKDVTPETKQHTTAEKPKEKHKQEKTKIREDKRNLSKKAKIKKGYEQLTSSVVYDESGEIRKIRTRKSKSDKKKDFKPPTTVITHAVITTENITIKQLSEKIGKTGGEIIKKLFDLGILKTINDTIDFDTAELIAAEFNVMLEKQITKTGEELLTELFEENTIEDEKNLARRPPVVTIMGHVDHGKTSILDYIRKSNVASGEAGGITQHIGAYTIKVNDSKITFIDTPGHEAFTAMRARGANVTDIVVIVVAGDDGVMPQTVEAINHAKAAGVQIIVAINKMDKQQANPDRVLQQLAEHEILVEEWGGTVPAVEVSAHTGMGIQDLLENIVTVAEIMELKANPSRTAKGVIIESRLDKGTGPVATILVQTGTLKVSDFIVAGTATGKIRAMFDDQGKRVTQAPPSTAVSILGLQSVPNAGDQIFVVNDEKLSKKVAEERKNKEKIEKLKIKKVTLEDVFNKLEEGKTKDLNLIIKADVQGSVEALKQSLIKLSNEEVKVNVVHGGVGAISESDIMLADTSDAIIIGFNIRPDNKAKALAERSEVEIKLYKIIYDVIDDIDKAIKGLLAPKFKETYLGTAEVRAVFKVSGAGSVAGCMVKDGKVMKNARVRLIRDSVEIFDTTIASLKRFKDDVREVAAGFECGISLDKYNDIKEGDVIEAYLVEEEKQ
ncbi:MAG TPA: translation initiation factor IF-2 [Clostridiales bacterium]|nr:translation initiation factor IF-2 [Clostridiales bacterium]